MENSFIVGKKYIVSDKKWGGSKAREPWTLKVGGLRPGTLYKFTPMAAGCQTAYSADDPQHDVA